MEYENKIDNLNKKLIQEMTYYTKTAKIKKVAIKEGYLYCGKLIKK